MVNDREFIARIMNARRYGYMLARPGLGCRMRYASQLEKLLKTLDSLEGDLNGGKNTAGRWAAVPPGRGSGGRDRRSCATQTVARAVPSVEFRVHPGLPDHRRLAREYGRRRLSAVGAGRAHRILHAQSCTGRLGYVLKKPSICTVERRRRRAQGSRAGGGAQFQR